MSLEFRVGAAAVDISPDLSKYKVPLHGYGSRGPKSAEGIHDPIYAKICILEFGHTRAAIITMDILQVDGGYRQAVVDAAGIEGLTTDTVIMCAAHDHSSPAAFEPRTKSLPPMLKWYVEGYCEETIDAIAQGLREAANALIPARYRAVSKNLFGAVRNRRVDAYNYQDRTFNAPEQPGEIIDNECVVVQFVDEKDAAIATLVNLAGHATVLGADNMLVSGDWPGYLQRTVEKRSGGVCLYANGAQGNVAPDCGAATLGFGDAEKFGAHIAEEVQSMVEEAPVRSPKTFGVGSTTVDLPEYALTDDSPFLQAGLRKEFALDFIGKIYPPQTSLIALRLDDIGLVTIPGEMLTELSVVFKKKAKDAGVARPFLVGLANDTIGYIPDANEYKKGGYEASMCFYGPTLGTVLVDAAVDELARRFA